MSVPAKYIYTSLRAEHISSFWFFFPCHFFQFHSSEQSNIILVVKNGVILEIFLKAPQTSENNVAGITSLRRYDVYLRRTYEYTILENTYTEKDWLKNHNAATYTKTNRLHLQLATNEFIES